MGSLKSQYYSYFLSPLPRFVRRRLHRTQGHASAVANFLHISGNYDRGPDELVLPRLPAEFSTMQQLIAICMYIHYSESFMQPSIAAGQGVDSPYHNIDLVEFVMGLPLRRRLARTRRNLPAIEKRVIQKLALRHLPRDIVLRKKAFTVSFERDQRSKALYAGMPSELMGIKLELPIERFGAEILLRWLKACGLPAPD